jgi:hypothetical protein
VRRLAPELERGYEQERARRLRDDLSVLYVALTRARHALHLWVEPAAAAAGGSREGVSFAAILRDTLGAGAAAGGGALYRAGDLEAVAAALELRRSSARVERQGVLPLSAGDRRVEAAPVLRPAVGLDDLIGQGELAAAAILVASATEDSAHEARWREVESWIAGGEAADLSAEQAAARAWLYAGGRRVERQERDRRFACSIRGTTVAGQFPRLWISSGPDAPPRALVGADLDGELPAPAGSSLDRDAERAVARRAEILRLAVSRALGLDGPSSAAGASVGVLLRGRQSTFVDLPG